MYIKRLTQVCEMKVKKEKKKLSKAKKTEHHQHHLSGYCNEADKVTDEWAGQSDGMTQLAELPLLRRRLVLHEGILTQSQALQTQLESQNHRITDINTPAKFVHIDRQWICRIRLLFHLVR